MNRIAPFTLAALLAVGATSVVAAQTPTDTIHKAAPAYRRTVPDSLVKLAKVSEDSARGLALARVPSGTLQAVMLQRLRGKLVWSFVIRDVQGRQHGDLRGCREWRVHRSHPEGLVVTTRFRGGRAAPRRSGAAIPCGSRVSS